MRPDWLRIGVWTLCFAFCLWFWIAVGGCAMGMFRRGDLPEPPPKELAALGLAPGYHVREMDPVALDKFCRAWGVAANDEWNKRRIAACVVPSLKAVILPPNASPEVRSHEYGHTWNVQHNPGGRGWDLRNLIQRGLIGGRFATTTTK